MIDDEANAAQPNVAGPQITGDVQSGRDTNIATQQTIVYYAAAEQQRRLEDYLALLHSYASQYSDQTSLEKATPEVEKARNVLRLAMARALMTWQPPAFGREPTPDLIRLDLVATILLPLATSSLIVLTPGSQAALNQLASPQITLLVLRKGTPHTGASPTEAQVAKTKLNLRDALAEIQYAPGCTRLLKDFLESDAGLKALGDAYIEHRRKQRGVPPALLFFAAGALSSAAGTALVQLVIEAWRKYNEASKQPDDLPDSPPAAPAQAPASTNRWSIPVTIAEWRSELDCRNEQFGAPAGYWCYVRPGTYRIGGWERDQQAADVQLPAFWIARIPVTVAQYAAFIEAGGYRDKRWWTPHGWQWRYDKYGRDEPYNWKKAPFNSRPQQTLTGVNWYEATACCAWLNAQFVLQGYMLRLPTETEWEVAAAYDERGRRRTYPWGEAEPTTGLAVFGQPYEKGAPDVASCPTGAAACGVLDIVGTVWECCANSYKRYPDRVNYGVKDFTFTSDDTPWRGGGYYSSTDVRCGARFGLSPGSWNLNFGFRVIVAPRLAHLS